MRVNSISNIFFHISNYKNDNRKGYLYPKFEQSFDTFERTTFTGKKEISPSRKIFDRLPQNNLTCLCCGRVMIPAKEIGELQKHHTLNCKAPKAVKILEKYENNMHSVEKEVFQILKKQAQLHPDLDFKEILTLIKPRYEVSLIRTQMGIFRMIQKRSQKLRPDTRDKINNLIETEKAKIMSGENKFRRKYFVTQFEKIFDNNANSSVRKDLINLAKHLPTAYEDKNAFIVKYANRSAEDIGIRLISYSMRTIEHVTPKNCGGENHIFNYIPECMRCNSFRSDRPMIQQLTEYPEMFDNAQKLMDTLIDFANKGKLSKKYIIQIQKRIYDESSKTLELDISRLGEKPSSSESKKEEILTSQADSETAKVKKDKKKIKNSKLKKQKKHKKENLNTRRCRR